MHGDASPLNKTNFCHDFDLCTPARPTDCGRRACFITLVDVDPSRAKHDLATGSIDNLPDTQLTNDRNLLSPRLLDKSVVEQLATRVVDVIPSTLVIWEWCLGLLTHWPVPARLVYACNELITLLTDEQVDLIIGVMVFTPRLYKVNPSRCSPPQAFQCKASVGIGLCTRHLLLEAFSVCLSRRLSHHWCLLAASLHFGVGFRSRIHTFLV